MARLLAAVLLALSGWLGAPSSAHAAVSCQLGSSTNLDFGRPGFPIGPVATTSTVNVTCSGSSGTDAGTTVLVCVGVDPTTDPRKMNNSVGNKKLRYNIFRDPAHSQILNYQTNAFQTLAIGLNGAAVTGTFTLFGQLTSPSPSNPNAGDYDEPVTGRWGYSTTATSCDNVNPATPDFPFMARASLAGSCLIQANDLDFGSQPGLPAAVAGVTSVVVTCTDGTIYRVSLNGGSSGTIADRRMLLNGTGPSSIAYNLYSDSARTQLWGDAVTGGAMVSGIGAGSGSGTPQSIPVYGLVPPNPTATIGSYSDVVTATVEY